MFTNDNHARIEPIDITRLLALEAEVGQKAATFKVPFKISPAGISAHLFKLSPAIIRHAGKSLENLRQVFELCSTEEVDPWDDKEFFRLSMRSLGLTYPSDFIDKIGSDDIVEGYDMERRQIFRNMRFMEASSYSLIEIFSYEWPQLFERSRKITELLIEASERVVWDENRVISSNVPKHFIQELRSSSPQACEVEHKYFAPLFSGPSRPGGILSTCSGRIVSAENDINVENLAFI